MIFFEEITSVEIEMSLNILKVLLLNFFVRNSIGLSIECGFGGFPWNIVGSLYTCYANEMWDFDEPNIKFINEKHQIGMNSNDVKAIKFAESDTEGLRNIPDNIHTFFPNIQVIAVFAKNNITEISSENLRNYKNLTNFDLGLSKITSIPGDFFKHNPKLNVVDFYNNYNLEHVGENLLGNLSKLRLADFRSNKCISFYAESPGSIETLNEMLLQKCPPSETMTTSTSTTTTSAIPPEIEYCPFACSADIQDLTQKLQDQQIINENLLYKFEQQQVSIDDHNKRIYELESKFANQ
jgi:hypothetical protein